MSNTTVSDNVQNVANVIAAIAPIVSLADPALGAILTGVATIAAGVAAAEPTAVSLYNQITSGKPPTAEELAAYIAANEASYNQLQESINAALAKE